MQIGPYRVVEEIARGGMGVVYRARGADGSDVALKLIQSRLAEDAVALRRFRREVKALEKLTHPSVVPILDSGEHEGDPWLALEFVDGQSLETRLQQGPLPVDEAIRVALQLSKALQYVHSCGLLHRDLKPDNILLRGEEVLLTDFGLALDNETDETRVTKAGMFLGTPGYWSPEQAQGEGTLQSAETDTYGLGAVLYACLTGKPPIQAKTLQEFLQTVQFLRYDSPRRVRPEVPDWLSAICLKCLSIVPAIRPGLKELEVALTEEQWGQGDAPPADRNTKPKEKAKAAAKAEKARRKHESGARPELLPSVEPPVGYGSRPLNGVLAGVAGLFVFVGLGTVGWYALASSGASAEPEVAKSLDLGEPVSQARRRLAKASTKTAQACLEEGRFDLAIEELDHALGLDPRNVEAYACRGESKAALGRYAEAIADFDRALQLNPNLALVYVERGRANVLLLRHADAVEDFDHALALGLEPVIATSVRSARAKAILLRD